MNPRRRLGLCWLKKKYLRVSLNFAGSLLLEKVFDVKCILWKYVKIPAAFQSTFTKLKKRGKKFP